jgi:Fur family ferric uptake transcriptional regulator
MHHARATLREQGYRLTPQRNLIWEVLRDAGRHMTAEEVAAEVRRTLPDVNLSTVYRTLELLVGLDLVVETRLEGSASYYEVSPEPTHHHFVCTCCGAVGHFGDDLLAPVRDQLGRRGFTVGHIQVTAFGRCSTCGCEEVAAAVTPPSGRA